MTGKKQEISRRHVLASVGVIGTGAFVAGSGTRALLSDTESVTQNTFTSGEIDLKVEWNASYHGSQDGSYTDIYRPLTDNPEPVFSLSDVKPCDSGEVTIGLHVYNNPAWVFMRGVLTENDENGQNDSELAAEGEDTNGVGELADSIEARLWYDGVDTEDDGGDNVYDPETDVEIVSGSLRDVLDYLNDGILLDNQVSSGGAATGLDPISSQNETVTTTFCGEFQGGPQAQQCIDCLPCSEPEVLATSTGLSGVCYEPDEIPAGATHVSLKAARGCYLGEVTDSSTHICLPTEEDEIPDRPNLYGEISNATFYRCESGNDGGDGGDGGNGGCWPNSTTQYLGLSWELPCDVGNEVQSDSVSFDLDFHAEQCRHNPNPSNPFAN